MTNKQYEVLFNSVKAISTGEKEQAQHLLNRVIEQKIAIEDDQNDLLTYIIATALMKRIDTANTPATNLYLQSLEIPQIHLFNLLANSLPIARMAAQIANNLLAHFIEGKDSIALCSIGIGTGRQELALLQELERRNQLPKKVIVYAIEPSEESVREARKVLEDAGKRMNIDLVFHSFVSTIEDLSKEDWLLIGQGNEPLLVNAAFSMHHMRDREGEANTRNAIMRKIVEWRPISFVLCEPYSNHHTADLQERFLNCWHHYSLLFQLINELSITAEEKVGLKLFFAREIEDILGNTEECRTEKHEKAEDWLKHLTGAGFVPCNVDLRPVENRNTKVQCTIKDGYISLDYAGESIVSILCVSPALSLMTI